MKMLTVDGISFGVANRQLLLDVSFCVASEEILGVVGPNGAGKSLLLNVLNGFVRTTRGQTSLNGHIVSRSPAWKLARLGVGRLFQEPRTFRGLSVLENVLIGC